jgi:PAS domain S-box-containing protein
MGAEQGRVEQLQKAVNAVAEAAAEAADLGRLYARIHEIVGWLLPARNLYIALYDSDTGLVTFPYFVDQFDLAPTGVGRPLADGLTDWVIRTGKPLLAGADMLEQMQERGEFRILGNPALDWLGVPLSIGEEVIGVLAVQTYSQEERYTDHDLDLLVFVSRQIAMAVHRKRAERALEESTRRLDALVNNLPGVAFRCADDTPRTMEYLSEGIEKLSGYRVADLIRNQRRSFAALVAEEDRARVMAEIRAACAARRSYIVEYRIRTADGEERWVQERGQGVWKGEWLEAIEGLIVDITERVRSAAERERLEARLAQAHRMESVGRLAGGVAHDLNNLLVPILGYTEILTEDLGSQSAGGQMLANVRTAAERARDLTRQLVAFTRRQILDLKIIDIAEVVRGFLKLISRTIREDVSVEADLPEEPALVNADIGQMEQVLMYLVLAAQDAMPHGGRLSVKVRRVGAPAWGVPSSVVVAVRDSGADIDAESREHLFEPFFAARGSGKGLALSTAYGIVKQHGGDIEVVSEPGEGTELRVKLPAAGESAETGEGREARSVPERLGGNETILLAEDDPAVREMTQAVLRRLGYNVLAAADGHKALELLRSRSGPLDLLLSDVIMPEMNGRVLAEYALRELPGIRILFVSGYTDDVLGPEGVLEPNVHLLPKPFTPQSLARAVRAALDAPRTSAS